MRGWKAGRLLRGAGVEAIDTRAEDRMGMKKGRKATSRVKDEMRRYRDLNRG